jgi:hypothetical protein
MNIVQKIILVIGAVAFAFLNFMWFDKSQDLHKILADFLRLIVVWITIGVEAAILIYMCKSGKKNDKA